MKVIITTGEDVRHCYFLKKAFDVFGLSIKGIILQNKRSGHAIQRKKTENKLVFKWLQLNYLIQSKRLSLSERITFHTSRKKLSRYLQSVPVIKTQNINSDEIREWLKQLGADMLLVFGGRIIKSEVISQFPAGIINLHMGLSPDYKGGHCIEWALYHGKPELVGATVHYLDEGIDSGEIIAQFKANPKRGECLAGITMRTIKGGIDLLVETFAKVDRGEKIVSYNQSKRGFCYSESHFTPEVRYGVCKMSKPRSQLRKRIENKIKREVFGVLNVESVYKKFFPPLPYPAVLVYHNIGDGVSPYLKYGDMSLSRERFRRHVEVLGQFYNVVSFRDIYEACCQGKRLEDTIAFSFDDGYKGILDAFSILKEKGFPATAYINSAFAGNEEPGWRNKMSYLVDKNLLNKLNGKVKDVIGKASRLNKDNVFDWFKRNIQDPRVEKIVRLVFADYGDDSWRLIYADWEELRNTDRNLFTFGNHTRTHYCLSSLTYEQQRTEIHAGRNDVLENLGDDK